MDKILKKRLDLNKIDNFILEFYEEFKPHNKRILDAACKRGRNTIFLAHHNNTVFAFDHSKTRISKFKEFVDKYNLGSRIKPIEGELDNLPFPDGFFDIVVSTAVLHHGRIDEISVWINEIERVLKQKGYLVASLLSENDFRSKTGEEIEKNTRVNISDTNDPQTPHHFFSKDEIKILLKNFKIIKTKQEKDIFEGFNEFTYYFIVAEKL